MSKAQEHIGLTTTAPSLGYSGKLEGAVSQLLDRPFIMDRCPLESGKLVPALMFQEFGS